MADKKEVYDDDLIIINLYLSYFTDSTHPVVNPTTVKQLNKEERKKLAWLF